VHSVTEGDFMKQAGTTFFIHIVEDHITYGPCVIVGILILPNNIGEWIVFPNGNGTLATITFKVIHQDRGLEKPPIISNLTLVKTVLIDNNVTKICHNLQQGQCEIMPTHIGDVNYDGMVDMADISIVARSFGETPEGSRWNPIADIDGDEFVDMTDIALVARGFGWTSEDP